MGSYNNQYYLNSIPKGADDGLLLIIYVLFFSELHAEHRVGIQ